MGKVKQELNEEVENNLSTNSQLNHIPIVNKKEIRVVGLKRTGNHAIINWLRQQHSGKVWHLNNIVAGKNPYHWLYSHYPKEALKQEALGNFTVKDCLIYSYEDYSLERVTDPKFENLHDLYLGKSSIRYDLILLRDPFNLMASRLKKNYIAVKDPNYTVTHLWIDYAKEFIGETNYLNNYKICINYNRWFVDVEYRKELASALVMDFSDKGIERVKSEGGGSSFDGEKLNGKASQMDVLNRYKVFEDDPEYQKLVDNEELIQYSRKIFGDFRAKRS